EDARNSLRDELQGVQGVQTSYLTKPAKPGTRTDFDTIAGALGVAIVSGNLARHTIVPTVAHVIRQYLDARKSYLQTRSQLRVAKIRKRDGTTVVIQNMTADEIENVLNGIVEAEGPIKPADK